MIPTEDMIKAQHRHLCEKLNVDDVELDVFSREFRGQKPDLITNHTRDGKVIGECKLYGVEAKWVIDGERFSGLVPLKIRKCERKLEIIPLLWYVDYEWDELDDDKTFTELQKMVDRSRVNGAD